MNLTPTELKQEIAITALNSMMRKSYFSICAVRDAAKILEVPINCEAYNTLNALHCVDFADMSPAVRQAIPHLIAECFNRPDIFQFQLPSQRPVIEAAVVSPKPKQNFVMRLLGKS